MMVHAQYKMSENQLGFRQGMGTETAIVRHIKNARTMKLSAVLDLKSAYDTVPRDTLHTVLKKCLDNNTLSMVNVVLQPMTVRTQGDASPIVAHIARGVPQGSP